MILAIALDLLRITVIGGAISLAAGAVGVACEDAAKWLRSRR